MRTTRFFLALAGLAGITACIARPGTLEKKLSPGAQWTVTIAPTATSTLRGTIVFVRTDPPTQTRAVFSLSGGRPNMVLPWHVHYGVCGDDQVIVGRPENFPPLMLGTNGGLSAVAQLPFELADGVDYVVHIHASPVDMKTVIACSPLVPERAIALGR